MDCKERSILAREAIAQSDKSNGQLADDCWLWLRNNGYTGQRATVLNAINRLSRGGSCQTRMLDAVESCVGVTPMPRRSGKVRVEPSKTLIKSGERQACATLLRQLICISDGRSVRDAHLINWPDGMRRVFSDYAPLKEGVATWEDMDAWAQQKIAPMLRGRKSA